LSDSINIYKEKNSVKVSLIEKYKDKIYWFFFLDYETKNTMG